MGAYRCTRLAQLSTTFCFSKFLFLWNPGSVMDYVLKMSFHLENINLIGKCFWDLSLYPPSTAQHNFLFFKISIFVKSRIGDGLCVLKMSFHLENINLIGKCFWDLSLYSPTTAQHNYLFFKNSIYVKPRIGDRLCVLKMSFHLENMNLIAKCY